MPDVLPGAEPASFPGGPHGALLIHGFTGCPQSLRGLAHAFADAGFATELPLLPGHGTSPDEMKTTGWVEWSKAVDAAYVELSGRCEKVVLAGLSMGGALASWLAGTRPEVAGAVLVNPAVQPLGDGMADILRQTLDQGVEFMPAVGNDVADPGQKELAYDAVPVASLLAWVLAQDGIDSSLAAIRCPILLVTSRQDHVVSPENSDYLASKVSVPVERVWLDRSYHVATLDYDRDEIERRAVEFARKVTA